MEHTQLVGGWEQALEDMCWKTWKEKEGLTSFLITFICSCVGAPRGERKSCGNVSSSSRGRTQVVSCGGWRLNLLSQLTRTGINFIFEALRIELLGEDSYHLSCIPKPSLAF